ncbi:MAG: 6-carboxytetrahydropterin synthase [Saprospiraceae bacterium]|nr:6-carboxytetrahydropterin synthase [Saprospiraceae bacterium]
MHTAVIRKAHFNAAHRLAHQDWSEERNREVFGLCANPHYHGHNYELDVRVSGEVNAETGMLIDLKDLKTLIYQEVEVYMDHKNLNLEVVEFCHPDADGRFLIPTAENICRVIYDRLRGHLPDNLTLMVRLYETPRNIVEYPA